MKLRNKNIFWAIFLLFIAVFILASQFNWFINIGVWSIIATALICAMIIDSIFKLQYFGIFFPMAFLYKIFEKPLGLPEISIWILFLVAILIASSFSMIFPNKRHGRTYCHKSKHSSTKENIDDNNPQIKLSFGESSKYLHSDSLKGGDFSASFGELNVYFDQVQLNPEGAEIYLDCSFGALNIFVPREWKIVDKVEANLGSVQNNINNSSLDVNAPCLTIKGYVRFGSIEIKNI